MCKCPSHQHSSEAIQQDRATQPGLGRTHRADALSSAYPPLHLPGRRRQTTSFQVGWEGRLGCSQNQHRPKDWVAVMKWSAIWCVGQCVCGDRHLYSLLTQALLEFGSPMSQILRSAYRLVLGGLWPSAGDKWSSHLWHSAALFIPGGTSSKTFHNAQKIEPRPIDTMLYSMHMSLWQTLIHILSTISE